MAKQVDIDKSIAEWQDSIDHVSLEVQSFDKIIAENITKKKAAQEEIEKYSRWILNAKEMFNLDLKAGSKMRRTTPTQEQIFAETKKFAGMKIPVAVDKILRESSEPSLTATVITNLLTEGGFETSSADFRNVVQNRLSTLAKHGKLAVEKRGKENYYSLLNKN